MPRLIALAVLIVLVIALPMAVAIADEVKQCEQPLNFEVGTFSVPGINYDAWTICASHGKTSLYWESDLHSDYDLGIACYQVSPCGDKVVLRLDDNDLRAGIHMASNCGWSMQLLAGEGPERIDVWTPCWLITSIGSADFSLSAWLKAETAAKPDAWPTLNMRWGRFSAAYGRNTRHDGDDYVYSSYQLRF